MNNKFVFGAVVGFFLACVVFAAVLFFSGTVKAEALPGMHVAAVNVIDPANVNYGMTENVVLVGAVKPVQHVATINVVQSVDDTVLSDVEVVAV